FNPKSGQTGEGSTCPLCAKSGLAVQRIVLLFDHFVCDGEHARRDSEPERLGCFQVDDKLELGRLQNRQVDGLLALQDSASIDTGLTIGMGEARSELMRPPAATYSRY